MKYRFIGTHAEDLDDGRMLEPGDFVKLEDDALGGVRVQTLVEDGKLVDVEGDPDATEDAVALAKENHVELGAVTGTGSGGRITVADVRKTISDSEGSQT